MGLLEDLEDAKGEAAQERKLALKLAGILEGVANALKGKSETVLHSFHDLPEVAERIVKEREINRAKADFFAAHLARIQQVKPEAHRGLSESESYKVLAKIFAEVEAAHTEISHKLGAVVKVGDDTGILARVKAIVQMVLDARKQVEPPRGLVVLLRDLDDLAQKYEARPGTDAHETARAIREANGLIRAWMPINVRANQEFVDALQKTDDDSPALVGPPSSVPVQCERCGDHALPDPKRREYVCKGCGHAQTTESRKEAAERIQVLINGEMARALADAEKRRDQALAENTRLKEKADALSKQFGEARFVATETSDAFSEIQAEATRLRSWLEKAKEDNIKFRREMTDAVLSREKAESTIAASGLCGGHLGKRQARCPVCEAERLHGLLDVVIERF